MYDLIGDIHGHYDKLLLLLQKLEYQKSGKSFRHPEGRKIIFVGDYIDRGPKIRETLHLVRDLVDSGDAIALMGNHEFNALGFQTRNASGEFYRTHDIKNILQHVETLKQFQHDEKEYYEFIQWMYTLPIYLELPEFRIVHACWDKASIEVLKQHLHENKITPQAMEDLHHGILKDPIEIILKGAEAQLPNDFHFFDKDGNKRQETRIKWWQKSEGQTWNDYSLVEIQELKNTQIQPKDILNPVFYSESEKPVFFGHYWLKGTPSLMSGNAACLDYSVAKGGSLCAYRYCGEANLTNSNFCFI